ALRWCIERGAGWAGLSRRTLCSMCRQGRCGNHESMCGEKPLRSQESVRREKPLRGQESLRGKIALCS
ncbi:MAG: hypothetical protein WA173_09315, partial [Pseudomonas sp.]|uniref:hypothetical protein n=1 Tax=Pseudomonas sp. TaxID=306 RepID=UPI003BB4B1D1